MQYFQSLKKYLSLNYASFLSKVFLKKKKIGLPHMRYMGCDWPSLLKIISTFGDIIKGRNWASLSPMIHKCRGEISKR